MNVRHAVGESLDIWVDDGHRTGEKSLFREARHPEQPVLARVSSACYDRKVLASAERSAGRSRISDRVEGSRHLFRRFAAIFNLMGIGDP
jgi:hypothetical protein